MNVNERSISLVERTLQTISTVVSDWQKIDDETKVGFLPRIQRLQKWKHALQKWKKDFQKTDPRRRTRLILQLHSLAASVE